MQKEGDNQAKKATQWTFLQETKILYLFVNVLETAQEVLFGQD